MAESFKTETYIYRPLQVLYTLIEKYVQDYNTDRASNQDPKKRRWIYPTFPEKDATYPTISIAPGDITFEPFGAGDFVSEDSLEEVYGEVAVIPISIYVFTKKSKDSTEVVMWDGNKRKLSNDALSEFLVDQISKTLKWKKDEFFSERMDFKITNITQQFDSNAFVYGKLITAEVRIIDTWVLNKTPEQVIGQIDLTISEI